MTMDSSSEEWKLYYRKHRKPPPRQCKFCGVDVSKGQSYCKVHKGKRKRELGTYICGYEGCQKPREYWKRRCEEHSVEKMKKKYH